MAHTAARLQMDEGIVRRLSPESAALWAAAHADGSDNRINGEAVMDAAVLNTGLGVAVAAFQGLKKLFRNREKSRADLEAEAEAAKINRSCGALRQMLLEYIQAARAGDLDGEALDELIVLLEEMQGYRQSGKLKVLDEPALEAICRGVSEYTAAIAGGGELPDPAEGFGRLRALLIRQREWLGGAAK